MHTSPRYLHFVSIACLIAASSSASAADVYLGHWAALLDRLDGRKWLYEVSLARLNGVVVGNWSIESGLAVSVGYFKGYSTKDTIFVKECIMDGSYGTNSGAAVCPDYDHQVSRLVIDAARGASLLWQTRPNAQVGWTTFVSLPRTSDSASPTLESCQ
jgi:hypothetical protein